MLLFISITTIIEFVNFKDLINFIHAGICFWYFKYVPHKQGPFLKSNINALINSNIRRRYWLYLIHHTQMINEREIWRETLLHYQMTRNHSLGQSINRKTRENSPLFFTISYDRGDSIYFGKPDGGKMDWVGRKTEKGKGEFNVLRQLSLGFHPVFTQSRNKQISAWSVSVKISSVVISKLISDGNIFLIKNIFHDLTNL